MIDVISIVIVIASGIEIKDRANHLDKSLSMGIHFKTSRYRTKQARLLQVRLLHMYSTY